MSAWLHVYRSVQEAAIRVNVDDETTRKEVLRMARAGELGFKACDTYVLVAPAEGRRMVTTKDGTCLVCKRTAPLVDGECPNCRH